MASRLKEDEKNERIIRNLLKLPDNRRCINCNSLGPQYVCTNFSTFVCTTCSGIHREFTHRVKSVSMAKFTSQEVSALQGGGNASAKEIYLKELDPQRNSLPDTSNVERLRTFIKHVYVDRRYTGERKVENRVTDSSQGGSRSPPYDRERPSPGGRSDDRNPRNSYNERRSPGFDQGSPPYADTRSPNRTGVVNDWRREDRFSNGRRSDDGNLSDGSSKFEGRSPEHQKDLHMSSPPVVRPVREILGDNVVPLRIIGPPKANGSRPTGGSLGGQRTLSSSSLASSNGNPAEIRRENSLIDFDAVSEPPPPAPAAPAAAVTAAIQQPTVVQTVTQPVASPGDNWACFDSSPPVKTSQAPVNKNSLESLFGDLSVSAPVPAQPTGNTITHELPFGNVSSISQSPFGDELSLFGDSAPAAVSANNSATFPPVGAAPAASAAGQMPTSHYGAASNFTTLPAGVASAGVPTGAPGQVTPFPTNGINAFTQVAAGGNQQNTVPFQPSFPSTGNQRAAESFTPAVGGSSSNQPWGFPVAGNTQGLSMPAGQTSQTLPNPGAQGTVGVNTSSVDAKPSGRKELPSDLFTITYPSPALVPGWQAGPHPGYGFNMQYNNVMPMPTYPMPVQSTNPFDNEASQGQAPTFPSMGPVRGAMPNVVAPGGLLHTSGHGAPSPWMPPQSSYPPSLPQQAPSFAPAIPSNNFSGGFMGQQVPSNLPARQPGVIGFGSDAFGAGPLGPNQHLGGMHPPTAPNANAFPSVGGNPFG